VKEDIFISRSIFPRENTAKRGQRRIRGSWLAQIIKPKEIIGREFRKADMATSEEGSARSMSFLADDSLSSS